MFAMIIADPNKLKSTWLRRIDEIKKTSVRETILRSRNRALIPNSRAEIRTPSFDMLINTYANLVDESKKIVSVCQYRTNKAVEQACLDINEYMLWFMLK